MSETTTWLDGKDCYRCGRHFDVLRPELWAYTGQADGKRQWFCSWKCLRAWQRENGDLDPEPEEPAGRPHDRVAFSVWDSERICRWIDSRKAYRKARWLRELNRLIDRWEGKLFGG